MASEPTPIVDLLKAGLLSINDGYRAKNSELSSTGIPFARAQNINNGFHFEDADRFPEEALASIGNKISAPGDVVFTSKGTVGRFALVRSDTPRFVYAPQLCFWRSLDHKRIDPRWIYYWMHSREFYVQYKGVAGQTDMAEYVSLGDQRRMKITVPDPEQQLAIAGVLGALDDKIDVNRKQTRVLQAISRAVFKSWFVDFDPVRRAAAGLPTGLSANVAALFPKRLVESPIGEVPDGWTVADVYSVADVVYGSPYKSDLFNGRGEGKPLIRIRDLATHNPGTFTPEQHPRGYLVRPGDLVVGMDGEFRAHMWTGPDSWLNQRLCCFKPKGNCPQSFVRFSIDQPLAFFERSKTGTTVVHLGKADIDTFKVLLPSAPVLRAFGRIGDPLEQRVVICAQQSATLAALRDALLPKLISGELRIADAEKIVGRAV